MNNAYQLVRLTNTLEKTYAQIRALGGRIIVNNYGEELVLGELRRGDAIEHSAMLAPTDFIVSIGDNEWDD